MSPKADFVIYLLFSLASRTSRSHTLASYLCFFSQMFLRNVNHNVHYQTKTGDLKLGVGIAWQLTIRFRFRGQQFESQTIIDAFLHISMRYFQYHTVCHSEFANHFPLW